MGLLLSSSFPAYAVSTDSTVVGGWDEDTGYFVNADAYNKAMEKRGLLRSDPVEEGSERQYLFPSTWLDQLAWGISLHESKNGDIWR